MKKYKDYHQSGKNGDVIIPFMKYKIIVNSDEDKKELMEAFEHIHYSEIDTDYIIVNQLAHEYRHGDNIIVNALILNKL